MFVDHCFVLFFFYCWLLKSLKNTFLRTLTIEPQEPLAQRCLKQHSVYVSDFEDGLPDAMMEMFDMEFDFPPRTHCLSRW